MQLNQVLNHGEPSATSAAAAATAAATAAAARCAATAGGDEQYDCAAAAASDAIFAEPRHAAAVPGVSVAARRRLGDLSTARRPDSRTVAGGVSDGYSAAAAGAAELPAPPAAAPTAAADVLAEPDERDRAGEASSPPSGGMSWSLSVG